MGICKVLHININIKIVWFPICIKYLLLWNVCLLSSFIDLVINVALESNNTGFLTIVKKNSLSYLYLLD